MEQVLLSRIQTLLGTRNRVNTARIRPDGATTASEASEASEASDTGPDHTDPDHTGCDHAGLDQDQFAVLSIECDAQTLRQIEQLVVRAKQQLAQIRVSEISHNYQDLIRVKHTARSADAEERSTDWQYHDLATSLDELADLLLEHNLHKAALSVYQRALDLRISAVVAGPASPLFSETVDWRVERAASHFKIAKALKRAGHNEAAVTAQTRGQHTLDETSALDQDAFALETFADQLEETALSAIDAGDDAGAAHCLSESLDLRLRAAQKEPDDPYFAKRFIESATEYSENLVGNDWRIKARNLADRRAQKGHPIAGAEQILTRAAVMGE